jgi:hypothetical protein
MKRKKDYEYSFNHVKERLFERYSLEIDRDFYDGMNESIKPYIGNPDVGVDNNGEQEIHTMFLKSKIVNAVYSRSRGRITTVLPRELKGR